MIAFDRFELENGLRVIVHNDESTPLVALNLLYDVGARDEDPERTGFAHLFEHLMFGGSVNIPSYDQPLERAGGNNNAFTSNDITNYYLTLPAENIETGFWLESDRMLDLAFSEKSLGVQRNVVMEEFKQSYLNQPYGEAWLKLRPLAYKEHPYRWSTIGKELAHIEDATLDDVKSFFSRYYCPNNAILVVGGNITTASVKELCDSWFAPIPKGDTPIRELPKEPIQKEVRVEEIESDVPFDAIYKAFHMCSRRDVEYHQQDLISDLLSQGKSSRFYRKLVNEKKLFSDLDAYVMGSMDKGLFVVEGKLTKGITLENAEEAIDAELDNIGNSPVPDEELDKVKNKVESSLVFEEMGILNKAMDLAFSELLGDADLINQEIDKYMAVTTENITEQAGLIFKDENSSTLKIKATQNNNHTTGN